MRERRKRRRQGKQQKNEAVGEVADGTEEATAMSAKPNIYTSTVFPVAHGVKPPPAPGEATDYGVIDDNIKDENDKDEDDDDNADNNNNENNDDDNTDNADTDANNNNDDAAGGGRHSALKIKTAEGVQKEVLKRRLYCDKEGETISHEG